MFSWQRRPHREHWVSGLCLRLGAGASGILRLSRWGCPDRHHAMYSLMVSGPLSFFMRVPFP